MTPAHLNANAHISTEERAQVLRWLEESHREFFAKLDRLAAEVLNLTESPDTRDAEPVSGRV